jgi:uncharacterized protein (DUF1501 family)
MKRRSFLQSASSASLPVLLNGFGVSTIAKSNLFNFIDPDSDRVLVLIQCNGGYDGLAMLHPLDQYSKLSDVRSNILIPENQTIKIKDDLGLHPSMEGLANLYKEEKAHFIQAVGYPNQNRSHFRSKDIWTSGSAADEYITTGWLGRYLDQEFPGFPEGYPNETHTDPFAITIGSAVSTTCQGIASNFSMAINDPFNLVPLTVSAGGEVPNNYYGEQLAFLRDAILKSNEYSEVITTAAEKGTNTIEYANSRLAGQLKNVALLIAGGLKTKIFVVNIGGFDTHANQTGGGDPTEGQMSSLLLELTDALVTFQTDLENLGLEERVITMNFTEFGRRIQSNGSFGTDHGSAAPLIVVGSCVNPSVLGTNVQLPDEIGRQAAVPMQYDFRSVYGSILMDWFDVPEDQVKSLLYDEFRYLPIIQKCNNISTSTDDQVLEHFDLKVFPNPTSGNSTINFKVGTSSWIKISLFDTIGSELEVVINKTVQPGHHQIPLDLSQLPTGHYYVRFISDAAQKTKLVTRI